MADKSKYLWHSGIPGADSEPLTKDREKAIAMGNTYRNTQEAAAKKQQEIVRKSSRDNSPFMQIPLDSPVSKALSKVTK